MDATNKDVRPIGTRAAHAKAKPPRPLYAKIIAWALIVIVGLVVAIVIGINIYVRVAYGSFFEQAEDQFEIPAINSGFICQDLDYLDDADAWLFSGYMTGDGESPLYKRSSDGSVAKINLNNPDGSPYTGHGSAITSNERFAFLASEASYLICDVQELAAAKDGDRVQALGQVFIDFNPAFMNIENGELYLGNFYYPGDYETADYHRIVTPDGTENPAVMYSFPADDATPFGFATIPSHVYSIPAKIQGTCQNGAGQIVLSQSYGAASSHLLAFDRAKMTQDGTFNVDGVDVPLYCLDSRNLVADIEAPPMIEGIESHDGSVWMAEESASNKYIFGKLYGAGKVYSIHVQ